jgi:hypothetical protein
MEKNDFPALFVWAGGNGLAFALDYSYLLHDLEIIRVAVQIASLLIGSGYLLHRWIRMVRKSRRAENSDSSSLIG